MISVSIQNIQRQTFAPIGGTGHSWAWVYNPLAVRETGEWLHLHDAVSVPDDVREMVEMATHADYLERTRAQGYGPRWVALWQRLYGKASAGACGRWLQSSLAR
jgi:hypothetical protein